MSTTSITTVTRDSLFTELSKAMLKQGNDYILYKNFLLGKSWDKMKVHYLFQYLNMLSNFSCDVEAYFNYKLKDELQLNTDTKISTDAIIVSNSQYTMSIQKTDSVSKIEWFLNSTDTACAIPVQENISSTIYVNDDDLIPYTGTLEDRIIAYINSLGYEKEAIDSDIWVDYIGDSPKP